MIPRSLIDLPQWCEVCGAPWGRLIMVEGRDGTVLEAECAEGHVVICPSKQVTVAQAPAPAPDPHRPVPMEQW